MVSTEITETDDRTVKILITLTKTMHREIGRMVSAGKAMSVAEFMRGAAEQKLKEC